MATAPVPVKGVLFDLDRTLVDRDSALLAYAGNLASHLETPRRELVKKFIARFVELDAQGHGSKEALFERIRAEYLPDEDPQLLRRDFETTFLNSIAAFPEALPVVSTLKDRGMRVGVVTNGSSKWQRSKLINTGLGFAMDAIVISEECGCKKPSPAIYQLALDQLGCKGPEAVFVGDNEEADVFGPKAVGMTAIRLRHSTDGGPTSADFEVNGLSRVLALVKAA